jgi:hypothetical protein
MVVSIAMLGFGAGGLSVTLSRDMVSRREIDTRTARSAILFALTAVLATKLSLLLPISLDSSVTNWLKLVVIYFACAVPFFFGGLVVSLILASRADQAGRYYGFDLAGAAVEIPVISESLWSDCSGTPRDRSSRTGSPLALAAGKLAPPAPR